MMSAFRMSEERDIPLEQHDFERWVEPADDEIRRARGEEAYSDVHGASAPPAVTAFRGRSYLDFLYGEVWQREQHLTRRDKRVVSICCAASVRVDEEVIAHLHAALSQSELTYEDLQELVVHYAVYLGWHLGAHLDDLLLQVARDLEIEAS